MTKAPPKGPDAVRAALSDMPESPGVYRMLGEDGTVLYVGKARHLKNRVASYASIRGMNDRILRMVNQIARIEVTMTPSEAEALLLEANLIKKHQPRYNILLKDDKSFPYIVVERNHPYPRIRKHRGAQNRRDTYYGPFASVGAVNQTLGILQKAFLLRPCSDSVFSNRSRPCLQYQIKRCSAPCVGYISEADYANSIAEASAFMQGKSRDIQERFAREMQALSDAMQFEKAALLRDRIRALTQVQQEQARHAAGLGDADVIALYQKDSASAIQVLFYRGGNHFGNQVFFPDHTQEASAAQIMAAFIAQFYQSHTPPTEILCNIAPAEAALLQEALALHSPRQPELRVPQRGGKRELITQAVENARLALERRLAANMSERKQLQAVADLFALEALPQRIEVYDNSHLMGSHALGAMIVATPDGFDKKSYRRFNSKESTLSPGDDYGMMREMFTRRFARLQKEDTDRQRGDWPDLVLIDGGQGQLSAVSQVFAELGISDLCFAAIAKGPQRNAGRETFFLPGQTPFTLPPGDPALFYLQRLRDEAHRFAIGGHRQKRAKQLLHSGLDDIPGIGPARKKALMHYFGSQASVKQASLQELEKVPGINRATAQLIHQFFHG